MDKPLVNCTLCSPIALQEIAFVRSCKETFKPVSFDAPEGKWKLFSWHTYPSVSCPMQPHPDPTLRRALIRSDSDVVCPGLDLPCLSPWLREDDKFKTILL